MCCCPSLSSSARSRASASRRYLDLGSVRELKVELDARGVVSKHRAAANGDAYGGQAFSRGALYQMLQNRVYRGEIVHKGSAYPGEHPAIVDEDLWRQVQAKLEANGVERTGARNRTKLAYLLAGVLFDAEGQPMTPTHAIKKGVRYRYYVSRPPIKGVKADAAGPDGHPLDQGQRLPAGDLERLVIDRFETFLSDPDAIAAALPQGRRSAPNLKRALGAAAEIGQRLASEDAGAIFNLLRQLVARAQVHSDRIDIDIAAERLADAMLGEVGCEREDEYQVGMAGDGGLLPLSIAAELQRAGKEMRFVIAGATNIIPPDAALVRQLTRAQALADRLTKDPSLTLEEAGAAESMGAPYAARLMRLNYLAPDIVIAILNGRQPAAFTANKLMADTRLLLSWDAQRKALGFA